MKINSATVSIDGKSLECVYDDERVCVFPYPLPEPQGRLKDYAQAAKAWLDAGNTPAVYVPPEPDPAEQLASTDKDMARVTEDLIDVLVAKGVIGMTDMPQPAQDKISERVGLREQL